MGHAPVEGHEAYSSGP